MQAVSRGDYSFDHIPNLLFKGKGSQIVSNGFSHKPNENYNNAIVDWSFYQSAKGHSTTGKLIMTLPNTGCAMDCPWCGGSRFAYKNIMGVNKPSSRKIISKSLTSYERWERQPDHFIYACVYSETKPLASIPRWRQEMGYQSVFFEQFHLTAEDTLNKMGQSTQAYIMLSPESHDPVISKLAGRGNYSMAEMEEWIPKAMDAGIAGIMVWFFIGMPQQTPQSVLETVAYSESLLKKFQGQNVLPLICPMVPFLDPGSRFFEEPNKHGYRIFYRTLEEHRQAMLEPLWYKRLNYETIWMSRREIQDITYGNCQVGQDQR
jgi:clorobiocin biosynthesis protein CloN6